MGMVILVAIFGVGSLVWSLIYFKNDMGSWFGIGEVLLSLLIGVSVGLFTTLVLFFTGFFFDTEHTEKPTNTIQIVALKDNSNMSGSFFLGSGTINETQKYYYMVNTNKGKQMRSVEANEDVYVKEGNIKKPMLETYDEVFTSKFAIFMYGEETGYKEYIFHIPEGSVTTEFNVDME